MCADSSGSLHVNSQALANGAGLDVEIVNHLDVV